MIPLRDTIRPQTFPIVNLFIIVINVFIFLGELLVGEEFLSQIFYIFGVVPSQLVENIFSLNLLGVVIPLVTAAFLHGGWFHIIGNMLFLWVFGDNVEDRMGHFRYLIFYLLVAIIANIIQVLAHPASNTPIIGASGAVAGILGAYYILFPHSKVLAFIPIFFFFTLTQVRASIFIILWFVLQIFNGVASLTSVGTTVAWWAHIGGFLGGVILIKLFTRSKLTLS